jgi:hypothetical protein
MPMPVSRMRCAELLVAHRYRPWLEVIRKLRGTVLEHFRGGDVLPAVGKLAVECVPVNVLDASLVTAYGFRLVIHGFPRVMIR